MSNDADIFVMLTYWTWKLHIKAEIQMERWDRSILSMNETVDHLGDKSSGLLAMHALSGRYTVSFP